MQTTQLTYVIGDIHGHYKKLVHLLQEARFIDESLHWIAGSITLWFLGDFVDRGPDGIAVIDLVMRLQAEAGAAGGCVMSLLGNHELMLLAAYRFGRRSTGLGSNFLSRWKQNGGQRKDIAALTLQHLDWLVNLLPMAQVGDHLLIHADAPLYIQYGRSVEEVNSALKNILRMSDALAWEDLLDAFSRRGAFAHTLSGEDFACRFLDLFGSKKLIHGHTPISTILNCPARKVSTPWIYAGGRCINVDGGMYLGGPGFIYQLA